MPPLALHKGNFIDLFGRSMSPDNFTENQKEESTSNVAQSVRKEQPLSKSAGLKIGRTKPIAIPAPKIGYQAACSFGLVHLIDGVEAPMAKDSHGVYLPVVPTPIRTKCNMREKLRQTSDARFNRVTGFFEKDKGHNNVHVGIHTGTVEVVTNGRPLAGVKHLHDNGLARMNIEEWQREHQQATGEDTVVSDPVDSYYTPQSPVLELRRNIGLGNMQPMSSSSRKHKSQKKKQICERKNVDSGLSMSHDDDDWESCSSAAE